MKMTRAGQDTQITTDKSSIMDTLLLEYANVCWKRASLNEMHVSNHELYPQVINVTDFLSNPTFRQRLWHIIHNVLSQCLCPVCKGINKWDKDKQEYRSFCSRRCAALGTKDKRTKTCLEKYGVEHFSKTSEFKQAIVETSSERFGTPHYSNTAEYKAASQGTCLEKYGTLHPMQNNAIKRQVKNTKIAKHGNANYNNQTKYIETSLSKYGTIHPSQSLTVKNKIISTNLSKYGTEYATQNTSVKEKTKNTNLTKYGRTSHMQAHISADSLEKLNNKEWLIQQHHAQFKPVYVIADELGVSGSHLCKIFHSQGIEIKSFYCSALEREIAFFVQSAIIGVDVEQKNRTIIHPKELDIFVKDKNMAIEVNGIFYHSELFVGKHYHLDKLNSCINQGIQLIQIFENEWKCKQNIVKSILLSALKCNSTIYARKCTIKDISSLQALDFYETNHIMDKVNTHINIGLFHNDTLVAAMSFNKLSENKQAQYALVRFCSILQHNVVGGCSKLFKYFVRTYNPLSVVSKCDKRLFTGNVYKLLGFVLSHSTRPDYSYFYRGNTDTLYNRKMFRKRLAKAKLPVFDPTLTELENMKNNGYNRIWDCGNYVFLWSKN